MRRWRPEHALLLLAAGLFTACVKSPTELVEHDEHDEMDASAATALDARVDEADGKVVDAQPMFDAGRPCMSANDCAGRQDGKLHCAGNGLCVECESNAECTSGSAPLCVNNTCRGCAQDGDCARFATTPVCGPAGACVACRADAPALCTAQNEVCIAGGNSCTSCNVNADCKQPTKPICEAHACRACTADTDCAGAGQVCHESTGRCVACKPNAQNPALENCANGNACDPNALTCTGRARRSLDRCGITEVSGAAAVRCVSDSECKEGLRCVATQFPVGQAYGSYCLQTRPEGGCPLQYRVQRSLTSALGVSATYCLPNDAFTTCDGLRSFALECASDADCGASGVADGLCVGAGMGAKGRCSYGCSSALDCDRNVCTGSNYCPLD
ncbi:MAG TPA: hypothetical protein VI299_26365 [Polyangiales bacterium]